MRPVADGSVLDAIDTTTARTSCSASTSSGSSFAPIGCSRPCWCFNGWRASRPPCGFRRGPGWGSTATFTRTFGRRSFWPESSIQLPVALALFQPGRALTRHTIAVAQMLTSAVLIHLTGGRIETHFHVFGSLAFLAFYRDWQVLITATVVVAADHFFEACSGRNRSSEC